MNWQMSWHGVPTVSVPSRGMDCDLALMKRVEQHYGFRPLAGYGLRLGNIINDLFIPQGFRPLAGYGLRQRLPQTLVPQGL